MCAGEKIKQIPIDLIYTSSLIRASDFSTSSVVAERGIENRGSRLQPATSSVISTIDECGFISEESGGMTRQPHFYG